MGLGKVAVLDDEPGAVFLVKRTLSEFDVSGFTTSDEFLNSLDTGFDCILLDVQLDEMSGYEICRQLRAQRQTENIPVIFISGDTTLSGRIAGYEAGGDDFITKPFDINELQAKVRRILAQQGYRRELISTVEESRQAAFEAMTHSAEQGEIVRFMEQISFCNSQASLADALLTLLSGFGLKAVVAFWPNTEDVSDKAAYFALNSAVSELEIELLLSAQHERRIMEFGRRMIVNYPNASLLIKNIPDQDLSRYGRIKDHLCVLLSATEARVRMMKTEAKVKLQQVLLLTVTDVRAALAHIRDSQAEQIRSAADMRQDMVIDLQDQLLLLNLNASQEGGLFELIERYVAQIDDSYREALRWSDALQPIVKTLEDIVQRRMS
ncbi:MULTISPECIES: response regulator transcription factor [Thalassolituus]|uniref:response regulator transcription factor n=1 Tax=Thalassolituus TaxID=187492 RepID=UPI0009492D13|nr:response regulator transcription factor [Thalassolituus oleivorans]APR66163.1 hypothetical protein CN03_03975 [Thalassolituus oleivorans]